MPMTAWAESLADHPEMQILTPGDLMPENNLGDAADA